jgi:hypothetical protein
MVMVCVGLTDREFSCKAQPDVRSMPQPRSRPPRHEQGSTGLVGRNSLLGGLCAIGKCEPISPTLEVCGLHASICDGEAFGKGIGSAA